MFIDHKKQSEKDYIINKKSRNPFFSLTDGPADNIYTERLIIDHKNFSQKKRQSSI